MHLSSKCCKVHCGILNISSYLEWVNFVHPLPRLDGDTGYNGLKLNWWWDIFLYIIPYPVNRLKKMTSFRFEDQSSPSPQQTQPFWNMNHKLLAASYPDLLCVSVELFVHSDWRFSFAVVGYGPWVGLQFGDSVTAESVAPRLSARERSSNTL